MAHAGSSRSSVSTSNGLGQLNPWLEASSHNVPQVKTGGQDDEFLALVAEGHLDSNSAYDEQLKRIMGSGDKRRSPLGKQLSTSDGEASDEDEDEDEAFVYMGKDADVSTILQGGDEPEGDYNAQLDAILGSSSARSANGDIHDVAEGSSSGRLHHSHPFIAVNGKGRPDIQSPGESSATSMTSTTFSRNADFPPRTPALSVAGSSHTPHLTPSKRQFLPQLSRLRSAQGLGMPSRSVSNSTLGSNLLLPGDLRHESASDAISRQSSISNVLDAGRESSSRAPSILADSEAELGGGIFRWSSLRKITNKIYPSAKRLARHNSSSSTAHSLLGAPTVIAASGVIVVGTAKGWVMVFDYASNLKCVLGTEGIVKDAGGVTSLAISHDHTFVGAGYSHGYIHLYDLAKPSFPARSVTPLSFAEVQTGRKEGHLKGSRVIHLGFVGIRHTAIVSADDTGLAFYHALGKVLGLASTDIVRILGRYPFIPRQNMAHSRKSSEMSIASSVEGQSRKPSPVVGASPLPLGPTPHSTDAHSLVALMTSSKLIIVGLKPTPRTWWRTPRLTEKTDHISSDAAFSGALSWFPSSTIPDTAELRGNTAGMSDSKRKLPPIGMDPLLAFAWGRTVRFVTVMADGVDSVDEEARLAGFRAARATKLRFVEGKAWTCDEVVVGLQWLNWRIVCILTATHFEIVDTQIWQRTGLDFVDLRTIVRLNVSQEMRSTTNGSDMLNGSSHIGTSLVSGSTRAYKGKVFVLTTHDMRLGIITSWADRILFLVENGHLVEAIELTTLYWYGRADAETIGLPSEQQARHALIRPKLREIMLASLDYVFSEDRMHDFTHYESEGRGVDRTSVFEGVATACIKACLAVDDLDFIFDIVYERYSESGIGAIYLDQLEPFILDSQIRAPPTHVVQKLIASREERGQFSAAEQVIWHVDPMALDINQAISLCIRRNLYDALVYVYTRALGDFVGPLVELLGLIKKIQQHRKQRPQRLDDLDDTVSLAATVRNDEVERLVPDAYKIFPYIAASLTGASYPDKEPLDLEEGCNARDMVTAFLFSGQSRMWPSPGGQLILTQDEGHMEPTFPYIRLLLLFDSEATMDAIDVAFEDSCFDDSTISRQTMIDLLLDVLAGHSDFTPGDRTFLNIFIARNLPKYPQFLSLPPSTLHQVLVGLASDTDQSTREDRQLAAEFLLSTYTPVNSDTVLPLLEEAGFWRIARSLYQSQKRWSSLFSGYLKDPECGSSIFLHLPSLLRSASKSTSSEGVEVEDRVLEAVSQLVTLSVQATAYTIERFFPSKHASAVKRLDEFPSRQFAYLRCLLEPELVDDVDDVVIAKPKVKPFLDSSLRLKYISLLCEYDAERLLSFLETNVQEHDDSSGILRVCEEAESYDAVIWQLERQGESGKALKRIEELLESRTDLIVSNLIEGESLEYGIQLSPSRRWLDQMTTIVRAATRFCVARSNQSQDEVTGETAWLQVLSSLIIAIGTVDHTTSTRTQPNTLSESYFAGFTLSSPLHCKPLVELLRSLLSDLVSSLIINTNSTQVSLSRIIRSLLDHQSSQRLSLSTCSTTELRSVILSVMNTFNSQIEVLTLNQKLMDKDEFVWVEKLEKCKQRGWKPNETHCAYCQELVWGRPNGTTTTSLTKSMTYLGNELEVVQCDDSSLIFEKLGISNRPPLVKRKKSLKGKEVDLDYVSIHDQVIDESVDDLHRIDTSGVGNSSTSHNVEDGGSGVERPKFWQGGGGTTTDSTKWPSSLSASQNLNGLAIMRDGICYHRQCWENVARSALGCSTTE